MPTRGVSRAATNILPNGRRTVPTANTANAVEAIKDPVEAIKDPEDSSVGSGETEENTESEASSPDKSEMDSQNSSPSSTTLGSSPSDKSMGDTSQEGSSPSDTQRVVGARGSEASGKRKRGEDDDIALDLGGKLEDAVKITMKEDGNVEGTGGIQHQMVVDMAKVDIEESTRTFKGLDAIVGGLVSRWAGMKFRAVKYLNAKLLDVSTEGSLLVEAEGVTGATAGGLETERQRPALTKYLRHKFNQMRDYFLQKVKTSIMRMRKFP